MHVEGWDGTLEGELEGEPYFCSTTGLKPVKERPIIRWTTEVQYGKVLTFINDFFLDCTIVRDSVAAVNIECAESQTSEEPTLIVPIEHCTFSPKAPFELVSISRPQLSMQLIDEA